MTGLPRSSDLTQSRIACFRDETTDDAKPRKPKLIQVWDYELRAWVTTPIQEVLQPAPKETERSPGELALPVRWDRVLILVLGACCTGALLIIGSFAVAGAVFRFFVCG